MADLGSLFGYDEKKATEGVRMVIGADAETEWLLVAKDQNKNYATVMANVFTAAAQMLEFLDQSEDKKAHTDLDMKLTAEVQAKTVFLGVGPGVTINGKKIKDDWKERQKLLLAPSDLRVAIFAFARDKKNFQADVDVAAVKKH